MVVLNHSNWLYTLRWPRHAALAENSIEIFVDRQSQVAPRRLPAQLIDFSRFGAQVIVPLPVVQGERVSLCLRGGPTALDLALPAEVRWSRTGLAEPGWHVGCQFDAEVTWETLGDLFLDGVLDPDRNPMPSSPSAE